MIYLRTADGQRVLFDTSKLRLFFEETEYDLEGATLDIYDARWLIDDTELVTRRNGSEDREPGKVMRLQDEFTGFAVEVPVAVNRLPPIVEGLADNGDGRRMRRLRKLLR